MKYCRDEVSGLITSGKPHPGTMLANGLCEGRGECSPAVSQQREGSRSSPLSAKAIRRPGQPDDRHRHLVRRGRRAPAAQQQPASASKFCSPRLYSAMQIEALLCAWRPWPTPSTFHRECAKTGSSPRSSRQATESRSSKRCAIHSGAYPRAAGPDPRSSTACGTGRHWAGVRAGRHGRGRSSSSRSRQNSNSATRGGRP